MSDINPEDLKRLSDRLKAASAAVGETDRTGELMMKVGRIGRPTWNIRSAARPEVKPLTQLALNDVVFVERSLKSRPQDTLSWLYVFAQPKGAEAVIEGWVRSDGVLLDPPEPDATVDYIPAGTNLLNIAASHYKPPDGFKWGDDARFYVAALAYVNKNYGGLTFPAGWTDADFKERGRWADIGVKADHAIWVPKRENLQALKGHFVSSGSISYELYLKLRHVAAQVWEAVVGTVAFAAGLVHGALLSVYDALKDIVELIHLVWKILKSLLTLEIVNDAKKLWHALKDTDWRQALGAMVDEFMAKWDADSTWARWYFRGEVVGYIIGTVILAVLTAGITAEISAAAKGGKLAKIVAAIANNPVVKRIVNNSAVKKIVEKGEDALRKAREIQEKLAEWRRIRALKKERPHFTVLSESAAKIPGTSVPESLRIKVGKREFDLSRDATRIGPDGAPIGPATKHMGEEAKHGPWNDTVPKRKPDGSIDPQVPVEPRSAPMGLQRSQVDFPMSSLASGLEEAEKMILRGVAPLSRHGTPGVFDVLVDGWHFVIDTNKQPWKVFHAQVTR
jgi:hypothetical protein